MKRLILWLASSGLLLAQPPNDNCQNASQLSIGGCINNQTTQGAGSQANEPTACFGLVGQSVWYWFQAGANDNVLRLIIDVTNSPNCTGTLAVYGPYNNAPNCMPTNAQAIHCDVDFLGTAIGSLNTAHYVDIPVQPNRYYMVQVRGFNCIGPPSGRYINFNICLRRACNHCGNLCLSNVCNYPSNSAPSVQWVVDNCASTPSSDYNPLVDQYSWVNMCFSTTAVNTHMYLGLVISGYCQGGNVYAATATVYSNTCTPVTSLNLLQNNLLTGLTAGQTYRICYRINAACPHARYYPFTYAQPLPVVLADYRAVCRGEGVEVVWLTAVEKDVEAFRVERSPDQTRWEKVAEIPPQGGPGLKEYRIQDRPIGREVYYRLIERTIWGGEVELGRTLAESCGAFALQLQQIGDLSLLRLLAAESGSYMLSIYDMRGQQLIETTIHTKESGEMQYIPLNLRSGVYVVHLRLPDGKLYTRRLSVQ